MEIESPYQHYHYPPFTLEGRKWGQEVGVHAGARQPGGGAYTVL